MSAVRRTQVVAAVIGAVAVALTLGAYFGHVFSSLERTTVDTRFAVRGSARAVRRGNGRRRRRDTQGARQVAVAALPPRAGDGPDREAHPRAIAVDIQFTELTNATAPDGRSCDDKLAACGARCRERRPRHDRDRPRRKHNIFGGHGALGASVSSRDDAHPHRSRQRHAALPYEMQKLKSSASSRPRSRAAARSRARRVGRRGSTSRARRNGADLSYVDVFRGRVPPSAFDGKVVVVGPPRRRWGTCTRRRWATRCPGPRCRRTSPHRAPRLPPAQCLERLDVRC